MTYTWRIEIDSEVHAVCRDESHVLHDLVINDHTTTEEEARAQAKTIVKMRALKDVLNPNWSADEAATYAIANADWLDNKLLDAARKRWGSANYVAEKWLLVGAFLTQTSVSQLAARLSISNTLSDFITSLGNETNAFASINELAIQKNGEGQRHGLRHHQQWIYCQGVMLQSQSSKNAHVAAVLSNEGQWQLMILEKNHPLHGRIESWSFPPTLENVKSFFNDTPDSEIETLIDLK